MGEITPVLPNHAWYKPLLSRWMQGTLDAATLASALLAAYALRFDFVLPADRVQTAVVQLPLVLLVQASLMRAFGPYSFVWRYVGMAEAGPSFGPSAYRRLCSWAFALDCRTG
jgi:FlaA1/EpsC-like NDP-sugar epimerase